ncbi:MAG: hypothetical protein NVSMB19_23440 [Vulcanimicrobiaceae bacterium]
MPTIFALLAVAAAVVFLAISVDADIYAPGSNDFQGHTRVLGTLSKHVPNRFQHDLTRSFVLRKIYSVVAFTVVGFFSAPLMPRGRRLVAGAILVTAFSLTIELVQRSTISHEGNLSSLFDLGCGALGGVLGAAAWNAVGGRFEKSPTA